MMPLKRNFSSGDIKDGVLRGETDACVSGAEDRLNIPINHRFYEVSENGDDGVPWHRCQDTT